MRLTLRRILVGAAFLAASLSAAQPVLAASLTVSPIRVQLSPEGRPETVRVRNGAEAPVLIQVDARPWESDLDAAARAKEILAVPPIFELSGGAEQVVRLAFRAGLDGPREAAYRLLVTEVPKEVKSTGLTFAVRFSLPVFVTPPGASAQPVWSLEEAPGGEAELVLRNAGLAHIRVEEVKLEAGARAEPLFQKQGIDYALAGEAVTWSLGQPYDALPPVLEVTADSNRGPLAASIKRARH